MEFLRSFLRRHLAGKPVVATPNVGCFLRLEHTWRFHCKRPFSIHTCMNMIIPDDNCTHGTELGLPQAPSWSSDLAHQLQLQIPKNITRPFYIWETKSEVKGDVTCCLHQQVLKFYEYQSCSCVTQGYNQCPSLRSCCSMNSIWVLWAKQEKKWSVWPVTIVKSDQTDTGEIALIKK